MSNDGRRKLARRWGAALVFALALGLVGGPAMGQEGYVTSLGGPSTGRLVPYYKVSDSLATIIGIENTAGLSWLTDGDGEFMLVHVVVFTPESVEETDFNLCLSEHDFGFIVLQKPEPNATQLGELADRGQKVAILSLDKNDFTSDIGYVTLSAVAATESDCSDADPASPHPYMYVWTILQDVGSGFFATEVPSPAANVSTDDGSISDPSCEVASDGSVGSADDCLLAANDRVGARYDVNPDIEAATEIIVWLNSNAGQDGERCDSGASDLAESLCSVSGGVCKCPAMLRGEDEGAISTTIPLPDEVNVIDPDALTGINQLKLTDPPQYRGVLEFNLPADVGFLFSFVSQAGQNFRETFLGYDTGDTDRANQAEWPSTTTTTLVP